MENRELLKQLRAGQDSPETLEKGGKGNGSSLCYRVQARVSLGCGPKEIRGVETSMCKKVLTYSKWETIHFASGQVGVPASEYPEQYAQHGFYSYKSAQALRWWFLAGQGGLSFIETRLVEYRFQHSYSAEPIRAICLVDPEMREDILPDWGKKQPVAVEEAKGDG